MAKNAKTAASTQTISHDAAFLVILENSRLKLTSTGFQTAWTNYLEKSFVEFLRTRKIEDFRKVSSVLHGVITPELVFQLVQKQREPGDVLPITPETVVKMVQKMTDWYGEAIMFNGQFVIVNRRSMDMLLGKMRNMAKDVVVAKQPSTGAKVEAAA